MREIKAIKVINHGNERWRIIIPRRLAGGKKGKTKFYPTKAAGDRAAAAMNIDLAAKINGIACLSGSDRAIISGLIEKMGSVSELSKAVEFYLAHNPKEYRTVKQLRVECIAAKQSEECSKKYLTSLDNSLRRFEERFENAQIHEITANQIHDWLYSGNEWKPVTRQGVLTDIRTLFSYALKRKYIAFNPALDVDWPKVSRKPPGIFTPEQFETLFDALQKHDPGLIPLVAMVSFNGLRPEAEAEKVESSFVSETHIDIPPEFTKNNHRRLVELLPITKAWLAISGAEFKPVNWQKRLRVVRRKAGLPWFHDVLRHSFCSYSVAIHGISKTAEMADNSERVLKHHYLERVPRLSAEKFFQILPR